MNAARQTFNVHLESIVASLAGAGLTGFQFYTGDEKNPRRDAPYVSIQWINQEQGLKPESRRLMCDIQVWVTDANTTKLTKTCEYILKQLNLYLGSFPVSTIPKKNFDAGRPGVNTGTQLILSLLLNQGWKDVPGPDQATRVRSLTVLVDYVPG